MKGETYEVARHRMVERQIMGRGVSTPAVLDAMRHVERHFFVPKNLRDMAYSDQPLPIGHGQTISQPYIVALMTELLCVEPADTVLEIGTGSGYQAAVLSRMVSHVYSIEIIETLADKARNLLNELGYENITVKTGDGYLGWPEHAPFDGIIVTAAPPRIPPPLLEQLAVGGKMVVPVGDAFQELQVVARADTGYRIQKSIPVRFVPMVGKIQSE
jgi:protein-L-isoaspartate(D-aspartate) O-methyltransferase